MQLHDIPLVTPASQKMPKYRQIATVLEEYLSCTKPAAGEKFFTDRVLAKHFSTTVVTISHSLNYLCSKGLLVRKVGSGTFIAAAAAKNSKRRIGIICHEMIHNDISYVTPVLSRFGKPFADGGYDVISFCAGPEDYRRLVDEYELSGAVIFVPKVEFAPAIAQLHSEGVPIISIGYAIPELQGIAFGTDHEKSIDMAVEYLYDLGHRRIALLHNEFHASNKVYTHGYQQAMWKRNLPIHPDWNLLINREQLAGAQDLWQEMPSAVILGHIGYAGEFYRWANVRQLRIPEDLSVIGLGDNEFLNSVTPQLTAVAQNLDAIAHNAAGSLLDQINGKKADCWLSSLPPILAERSSCAPINKK